MSLLGIDTAGKSIITLMVYAKLELHNRFWRDKVKPEKQNEAEMMRLLDRM